MTFYSSIYVTVLFDAWDVKTVGGTCHFTLGSCLYVHAVFSHLFAHPRKRSRRTYACKRVFVQMGQCVRGHVRACRVGIVSLIT